MQCYCTDVIATLIVTNFHLCLIQLWWQFFQIFVYDNVVYSQTWDLKKVGHVSFANTVMSFTRPFLQITYEWHNYCFVWNFFVFVIDHFQFVKTIFKSNSKCPYVVHTKAWGITRTLSLQLLPFLCCACSAAILEVGLEVCPFSFPKVPDRSLLISLV